MVSRRLLVTIRSSIATGVILFFAVAPPTQAAACRSLSAERIAVSVSGPSQVSTGQRFSFSVRIRNAGSCDIARGSRTWSISTSGANRASGITAPQTLAAGESFTFPVLYQQTSSTAGNVSLPVRVRLGTREYGAGEGATYRYTVFAPCNATNGSITVARPELSSPSVNVGGSYSVSAWVTNTGTCKIFSFNRWQYSLYDGTSWTAWADTTGSENRANLFPTNSSNQMLGSFLATGSTGTRSIKVKIRRLRSGSTTSSSIGAESLPTTLTVNASQARTCPASQGSLTGSLTASPASFTFNADGAAPSSASSVGFSATVTNNGSCIIGSGRTVAVSVAWNGTTKSTTFTLGNDLAIGSSTTLSDTALSFSPPSTIGSYATSSSTVTLNGRSATTLSHATVTVKCPQGGASSGDCAPMPSITYGSAADAYLKANSVMPAAATCGKSICFSVKNIGTTTWNASYKFIPTVTTWGTPEAPVGSTAPGNTATVSTDLIAPSSPGLSILSWRFKKVGADLSGADIGTRSFNITCATSTEHCATFINQVNPLSTKRLHGVPFSVTLTNYGSRPWDTTYELVPAEAFSPSSTVEPNPMVSIHTIAVDGTVGTNTVRLDPGQPVRSFPAGLIKNKTRFIIDFWTKNPQGVLLGDTTSTANGNFWIEYRPEATGYYAYRYKETSSWNDTESGGPEGRLHWNDNRWHHIVISYNRDRAFTLSVDGQSHSSVADGNGIFTVGGDTITLGRDKAGRWVRGGRWWSSVFQEYDRNGWGEIDELKIFDELPASTSFTTVLTKSSGTTSYNQTATFTGTLQAPARPGSTTITWRLVKRGGTPSITPNPAATTAVTVLPGDVAHTIRVASSGFERPLDAVYAGDNVVVSFEGDNSAVEKIIRSSRGQSQKITAVNKTKRFPPTGRYNNLTSSIRFSLGTVDLTVNPTTGVSTPLYELRVCPVSATSCP